MYRYCGWADEMAKGVFGKVGTDDDMDGQINDPLLVSLGKASNEMGVCFVILFFSSGKRPKALYLFQMGAWRVQTHGLATSSCI